MQWLDWLVLAGYFVFVFGVAAWATFRRQEDEGPESTSYFLAGRHAGWLVIGASLFASNIGSEHLVGLAGSGFSSGVPVAQYEVIATLMLLLLGWVFVPFYLASGVTTMPEFLERRYSSAARWYLAAISIVAYVLTKISVTLFAGGIVFESLLGVNFWWGAAIIVVATGLYTVLGGLRAVLWTDLAQTVVLLGGAITLTILGLIEIGGWNALWAETEPATMSLWRPLSDKDFPWTGIILGAPILGCWYWCTDQFIVQRTLSAENQQEARGGTIFAGFLKLLPLFIFVIPGIIAFVLFQRDGLEMPLGDEGKPDSNQALTMLATELMPLGLRGLFVAGLAAALMSSLSSVFNSCSTLVTWDIYRKLDPEASESRLVLVGQIATGALVVVGLAWIPFMAFVSGQLYQYLQAVQAYIAPPIAAVFLLGLFIPRLNAAGAVASLWTGFVFGALRLVLEVAFKANTLQAANYRLGWFVDVAFLHFAVGLFVVCSAVLVIVSLVTPAPDSKQIEGLTYATAEPSTAGPSVWQVGATVLLIAAVAGLWVYFS